MYNDVNKGRGLYNTFVGDTAVNAIYPDSDQTIQWNATGSPNYAQINEAPLRTATRAIFMHGAHWDAETAVGQIDDFLWQPIMPFTRPDYRGPLAGICPERRRRHARIHVHSRRNIVPPVPEHSAPVFYPSDSYVYFDFSWDHDPSLTTGTGPTIISPGRRADLTRRSSG